MDSGGSLNQPYIFLGALYIGVVMGIFYLLLRFLEKHLFKKAGSLSAWLIDMFFWPISGGIAAFALNGLNHLELKAYVLPGIFLGFFVIAYRLFITDK